MNLKKLTPLLLVVSSYILLSIFAGSCANSSISPTGGPRDSIPPQLVYIFPEPRTVNFNGKEIVFAFDEYVQIKDQNKQFVISPPLPGKQPLLKLRKKSVVVKFVDAPAPETTYYLDFGTSVSDLNEGNPAEQLNYTFSTGGQIDTMTFAGKIVDALTLEPVADLKTMLYEDSNDSIVFKQNPAAYTRSDKDGAFFIKGLKNMQYKFVAFLDANNNNRYELGEEIAFSSKLISPMGLNATDTIFFEDLPTFSTFKEGKKRQSLYEQKRIEDRLINLVFNAPYPIIEKIEFAGIPQSAIVLDKSAESDTISYWIKSQTVPDTIKAELVYMRTDSLNILKPDTVKLKFPPLKKSKKTQKDEEEEIIPVEPSIVSSAETVKERGVKIKFKTPLLQVDTSKIKLMKFSDSGEENYQIASELVKDTSNVYDYTLNADWVNASKYELQILPDAFVDIYRFSNDTIIKKFESADPEKYGKLNVTLKNADSQYIVQIMNDKNVVAEKVIKNNETVMYTNIPPGKYRIKLIKDDNNNGRWDGGDYLKGRQPEQVLFLIFGDKETIELRANWDLEQEIDINELKIQP